MQQSATVQVASTASLQAAERFPYWADVITQLLVPLECDTPARRSFTGSIRHRQIGRIGITDVRISALLVRRTRAKIAQAPSDDLIAVVHVDGRCNVAQRDREALLRPRDGAVVSTEDIYSFDFPAPSRQLVLKVPRGLLRLPSPDRAFRLACGPANLLRHLAFAMLDEPDAMSSQEEAAIERALAELLRSAASPGSEHKPAMEAASARHAEACLFIQQNLADPALNPAAVAAHVRLSVRSLARLFALHGETIERTIWSSRLAAAKNDLADPRQRGRSITEIAFQWGFNDAAHFSRSFAKAYGTSPGHFRLRGTDM